MERISVNNRGERSRRLLSGLETKGKMPLSAAVNKQQERENAGPRKKRKKKKKTAPEQNPESNQELCPERKETLGIMSELDRNCIADLYETLGDGRIRCGVCPRKCVISEGHCGFCGVRENSGGRLRSLAFGYPVALQIDPIEKKPLQHYRPGTRTFSVGTFGCNLACRFCQNDHLSRAVYHPRLRYRRYEPRELVDLTIRHGCDSISFTYNEPTVWLEYAMAAAEEAKRAGLGTVLVSNAFIELRAAEKLYPLMEAANVDVKGFSEEFYQSMCKGSLEPVKQACEFYKKQIGGHLELTNLVIPGKNSSREMIDSFLDWVEDKLGRDTPVHFTAYHPAYLYHESPRTPLSMLEDIQAHAKEERGFPNVYLGNLC